MDLEPNQEEMDIEPDDANVSMYPEDCGFTILGEVKETRLKPTKAALPKWIMNGQTFDKDITKGSKPIEFLSKYLSDATMKKMKVQGMVSVFPVQAKVIPFLSSCLKSSNIICPPDICVAAPTGSGKTLTFVLPIIEYLSTKIEPQIRVLVVVPVGHLATQIKSVFDYYSKGTRIRSVCATGSGTLEEDFRQIMKQQHHGGYICAVDIVVCTPGRLTDLMQRMDGFNLTKLELIVLDEADRVESNEMEHDWISKVETKVYGSNNQRNKCYCCNNDRERIVVNACCPCSTINYTLSVKPIQKWLFSATLTNDPMKFQELNLYRPRLFRAVDMGARLSVNQVGDQNKSFTPTELSEKMIIVEMTNKPLIVWFLMSVLKYKKVLCFTGSIENTSRLHLLIEQIDGIICRTISSKVSVSEREKILRKFSDGKVDILVCSDLMARGIDISDVNYVINYDPPKDSVAYIHRIGRTARAGKVGTAITLVTKGQVKDFRTMVRNAHKLSPEDAFPVQVMDIKNVTINNCKKEYQEALVKLPEKIKSQERHQLRRKN